MTCRADGVVLGDAAGWLRRPTARAVAAGVVSVGGPAAVSLLALHRTHEAKYREIRDAELDHSTGKLSDGDYEELDRNLRAEAIEILRALDRERALPSHGQ